MTKEEKVLQEKATNCEEPNVKEVLSLPHIVLHDAGKEYHAEIIIKKGEKPRCLSAELKVLKNWLQDAYNEWCDGNKIVSYFDFERGFHWTGPAYELKAWQEKNNRKVEEDNNVFNQLK